jgi:ribosomal protein S18 acetylase RimI-like enzyme
MIMKENQTTQPVLIRPYQETDWERMAAIHDPARQSELAFAGLSAAFVPFAEASQREGLFDYDVYVAEYDGVVAGFIAFCEEEIAWLYVDVAYARRGIGRSLVQFALERVNDDVAIEVLAGNEPALALYTACGFRIQKTLTGVMPGNEEFSVTAHVLSR